MKILMIISLSLIAVWILASVCSAVYGYHNPLVSNLIGGVGGCGIGLLVFMIVTKYIPKLIHKKG